MGNSLPPSVRCLIDRIEATDKLTPTLCRDFLQEADITAKDLQPWSDFGHPKADSYGRNLVHDGGFFELMVMSWIDGDMAAIHDHGYTQWGAVRVYGQIEHAVFKVEDGRLVTADRREFSAGSVVGVAHDLIHQMGNVGQEPYLTLHLYGCHGRQGDVTGDTRLYDLDEGKIQVTSAGVFFNLPEGDIARRQDAPRADFPTYLRHQVEMLKRLMVVGDSLAQGSLQSEREQRLATELFADSTWRRFAREWHEMTACSSSRFDRYTKVLNRELKAAAALQRRLIKAELVEAPFDVVRLSELLAFSDLEIFAEGYLDLVSDTYSLGLSSLVAA